MSCRPCPSHLIKLATSLVAVVSIAGVSGVQPAGAARTAAAPSAETDIPAGSSDSAVVSFTTPLGTKVSTGRLALQAMPCTAASGATYSNNASNLGILPVGVPILNTLASDTAVNTGRAVFDRAAHSSDYTETSTIQNLSLLNGAITADVVKSVARITHTGSTYNPHLADSLTGTRFTNLVIGGVPQKDVFARNTTLPLPLIGSVTLNEVSYAAPALVRVHAIHVHLAGVLGNGDITIANPVVDLKAIPGKLAAGGYSLRAVLGPVLKTGFIGNYGMPCIGTSGHDWTFKQAAASHSVGNTPIALLGALTVTVNGKDGVSALAAKATTEIAGANLLNGVVTADAITSVAGSGVDSSPARSNGTGSSFVGLKINGNAYSGAVAPNTTLALPGLGSLVLNEQICHGDGVPETICRTAAGHVSNIETIAIHLTVTVANNSKGLPVGAEVIIARAKSGVSN